MTTDTVFNTDPMPSVMSRRWLDNQTLYATPDTVVDAHLTWDAIQAAAKEAWIEGLCMNYDTRSDCVLHLHEVAIAFEASGRRDSAVALKAVCPGLMEVKAAWYGYILGWKDSKKLDLTQGSASQNLAQTILANINAYRLSPSDKLFQYSAHDTKVASLAVTFGDQGDTTMHPHYAATL
ncbi:hypothetical protein JKF63_00939 [Porcisia hertigi]|uniref:Histidine acid phosphatase n=1 Tax=Porcisia hertigi TaxID=2761500 RepID=A0A836HQV4_9TRYP|nr:hypothetical protein JKF63_00939 [Porcisia hertigi]